MSELFAFEESFDKKEALFRRTMPRFLTEQSHTETVILNDATHVVFQRVAEIEGISVALVIAKACESLAKRYRIIVLENS